MLSVYGKVKSIAKWYVDEWDELEIYDHNFLALYVEWYDSFWIRHRLFWNTCSKSLGNKMFEIYSNNFKLEVLFKLLVRESERKCKIYSHEFAVI